jgi:hypothetical protein
LEDVRLTWRCYWLLDVETADGHAGLRFGTGTYFDVINTCGVPG